MIVQSRFLPSFLLASTLALGLLSPGCGAKDGMPVTMGGDGGVVVVPEPILTPSTMAADLMAAGLDIKNLPPIKSLPKAMIKAVMHSFTKSLGTDCNGCHVQGDFAAQTPRKNVAAWMWDNYVRGLGFRDGKMLYCDSCHQGSITFLKRTDKEALAGWMKTNFVEPLQRTDGAMQNCAACHGTPFDPMFLQTWRQMPPS